MDSPFDLNNPSLYARWRDIKLANGPTNLNQILVEIADLSQPSSAELDALRGRCLRYNMAVYVSPSGSDPDPQLPLRLAQACGLQRLDHNWLGDDTGLTSLTQRNQGTRQHYIPYTNRPIRWHTDGYYNTPQTQIHGLLLHCVTSAATGGENRLLDQQHLYIQLRERDPELIRALMRDDAMSIPLREGEDGSLRDEQTGPVFSITAEGELHMRFTERERNIRWNPSADITAAVAELKKELNSDLPFILSGRLEPGMGLVCNNVLHDRSGFDPDTTASPRLLYRGRYYDRISGSGFRQLLDG